MMRSGRSTPARLATRPEYGPAAMTTNGAASGPRSVSTPATRPSLSMKPVTVVLSSTVAPDARAKPKHASWADSQPSPWRKVPAVISSAEA
jgi:hypothetical protein